MDKRREPDTARSRARELRRELERHNRLYYVEARQEITDREYDLLYRELQDLEARHPSLVTPDSPTQRVGGEPIPGFERVVHAVPMMSLDNTYTRDEIRDLDRAVAQTGRGQTLHVCRRAQGGRVAFSLRYEEGMLVVGRHARRQDQGDDITANLRTIRSIPLRIDTEQPGSSRFAAKST